jgi:fumarate hydratase subunit beta
MIELRSPLTREDVNRLKVGDTVVIVGDILAGRDAVLPRLAQMTPDERAAAGINLEGAVIFHTAVSGAGIGPTSSNKVEIEGSMPALSRLGVRMHVGKGMLSDATVQALAEARSVYAVTPPVSALQTSALTALHVLAFAEEGMEALHLLTMSGLAVVVAIAHGESIWKSHGSV